MAAPRSDLETWKNQTPGTVVLRRLDHRGEMNKDEVIEGGRTFHISPTERRLNQEAAAEGALDVFSNGILTPVRLLDDSDESREIASNPNLLSETDMRTLIKGNAKAFDTKLGQISNGAALHRMLVIARAEDAPVSRVDRIEKTLSEVAPSLYAEVSQASPAPVGSTSSRGVTPR